ncbi:carbon starvation induced protein CsiD [Marinomonas sp. A79]|uniref:Carbon starvation induced protein CsiD n=1 Tax=Marinomonas vulgaris TaxID=2823372 RepID=A0ABS5H8Y4_9GAMM|nr:glutarate dioxygenase GlaH [Marinomonas vulgaris]MBR7888156.1 carbon starvation induced protein CsiD [Marinomonas vulgaris]
MSAVAKEQTIPYTMQGFTVADFPASKRLQIVTLDEATITAFADAVAEWTVQGIEYKPFLRFEVADRLDKVTGYTLGKCLNDIVRDRATGAFLLNYQGNPGVEDGEARTEFEVKLSTAISHIIGLSNHDAMYGQYYARFTVRNVDNSDSYLRKPHRRMELHNDGTYVNERTDYVLMQKLKEENMQGGNSLLLHVDDWAELETFAKHPLAKQDIVWGAPKSKNVDVKVEHPVFFEEDADGNPMMLYIDQFAEPSNKAQGKYLFEMGESLEADPNFLSVPMPVGSMLVIHNHFWLHGRDKFVPHPGLCRELLRQRGHFTD